jgi:hypothetical protein
LSKNSLKNEPTTKLFGDNHQIISLEKSKIYTSTKKYFFCKYVKNRFPTTFGSQIVLNKDHTIWLDGGISPPKFVCKFIKIVLLPNHLSLIYDLETKLWMLAKSFYIRKRIQIKNTNGKLLMPKIPQFCSIMVETGMCTAAYPLVATDTVPIQFQKVLD